MTGLPNTEISVPTGRGRRIRVNPQQNVSSGSEEQTNIETYVAPNGEVFKVVDGGMVDTYGNFYPKIAIGYIDLRTGTFFPK
jgi:hypothetical protein